MPAPPPNVLRDRIVEAYNNGEGSFKSLGERFKVGEATVNRLVSLERRTGSTAPKPMGGYRRTRKVTPEGEEWLRELVKEQPSRSLPEMSVLYEDEFSVAVASRLLGKVLKRLGITKKRRSEGHSHRNVPMWSCDAKNG